MDLMEFESAAPGTYSIKIFAKGVRLLEVDVLENILMTEFA